MEPPRPPFITLTTDFGSQDGFVGTLMGVIWSICPAAQIADISHAIAPQNVLQGALTLARAYPFFPNGTVHVAVVDPGVGTSRRPIAACLGKHFFIGPDNGLFTPVYERAAKNGWPVEVVHLTNERFWLPAVSRTFHGRDIFAPVAAHLASGVPFTDLGPVLSDPVRIALPRPEKIPGGWRAHVTIVDVFGNCTLDLPAAFLAGCPNPLFRLRGRELRGLVESYGRCQPGELIALVDSENNIEIALVNGSAAALTGARVGDEVEVVE